MLIETSQGTFRPQLLAKKTQVKFTSFGLNILLIDVLKLTNPKVNAGILTLYMYNYVICLVDFRKEE